MAVNNRRQPALAIMIKKFANYRFFFRANQFKILYIVALFSNPSL